MNEKYQKLEHKQAFCKALASRLGIEKDSVRVYLETKDNIPKKHLERINKALDLQLSLDKKTALEFDKL